MSKFSGKKRFIDLDNTREPDQHQQMEEIAAAGHCPFCPENMELYHKEEPVAEGRYWLITPNHWPYENTKVHWLAIHRAHIEHLHELSPEASAELFQLLGELETKHHFPGGGLAMRFGDTDYSAGTVAHLHAHLLIPALEKPDFKPLRFKIGKG